MKRTGESLVPKTLWRNCPDDDPLAVPTLAVVARAGGARVEVPRPSSRAGAEEEVVGDEAEAGEMEGGTVRECMVSGPWRQGTACPPPSTATAWVPAEVPI